MMTNQYAFDEAGHDAADHHLTESGSREEIQAVLGQYTI